MFLVPSGLAHGDSRTCDLTGLFCSDAGVRSRFPPPLRPDATASPTFLRILTMALIRLDEPDRDVLAGTPRRKDDIVSSRFCDCISDVIGYIGNILDDDRRTGRF